MSNEISRLDEIGKIIKEDEERMGPAPSVLERADHYAVFGLHKVAIEFRRIGREVAAEIGEIVELVQNPKPNAEDSD